MAISTRTDEEIQANVLEELKWDTRVRPNEIGIVVKPQVFPSGLKKQIERALVRNAETDARRMTIEVEGSKVILRGTVRSYAEKQAAEDTAWSAPGVTEVENRIVISPML